MLKKDINKGFLIVTQVSDNEHSDYKKLCAADQQEFLQRNYKRELHQHQFIASRLALQSLFEENYKLTYTGLLSSDKKPLPIQGIHISLSHSNLLVSTVISEKKVGIDIQEILPRIDYVLPRICSQKELLLATDEVKKTILWCAKEALYKYVQSDNINFKNHLLIDSLDLNNQLIRCTGRVIVDASEEPVILEGQIIGNHVLVYTT